MFLKSVSAAIVKYEIKCKETKSSQSTSYC